MYEKESSREGEQRVREMKRLPVVFSALVKEGFSEQVTFEQT